MDILIQPKSTTRPVPSVRYRHTEKYDGGPFLTYPLRRNKPWMIPNDELGESNFSKHEVLHPTPHEELESFLQIWLYFGLIFEFLFFGNKGPDSADREDTPRDKDIRMMYDLFRSDDRRFIISSEIRAIFPELFKFSWESKEDYLRRCKHLDLCLIRTNFVLDCVGPDFDPSLKFAIAALEDYLGGHISRACVKYQFGSMYFNISSKGTHSSEICGAMEKSGWCPSDIQRIKDKYPSVQTWNLLSQLDRSEPPRDHSGCSKFICTSYQIDTRNYRVGHCLAGCTCSEYLVDNEATIAVLQKPGLVPLLDIRPGLSLAELKIDVIESSSVLYIAISHVWADGLGNPSANSLHRCQLARLKTLVADLAKEDASNREASEAQQTHLLWIDTLCCPVRPAAAKQLSLEKITTVYRDASHVLVLDASLKMYTSKELSEAEILGRIFTSSWMRRLWTLQEGALAKSLYFQFADKAISLLEMMQSLSIITTRDSRYWGIFQNFNMELLRLQCFFGTDSELWDNSMLLLLDQALQYRSVSVMSDEPLCIATLLGLDISQVLEQVNHDERMQKLWILISEKFGGISAGIAFYEDNTLASQGWRWASRSLIPSENSSIEAHYRSARWKQERLGEPTAIGLRISRSGFLLKQKHYDDGLPLHPWPGIRTRPERRVLFRDGSGKKFAIYDSFRSQHWDSWSTQTREEYDEKHQRPISRAILRGGSAVVLVDGLYNSHFTAHDRTRQGDSGLLVGRNTYIKENGQELAGEIVAEKYMRVILAALYPTDEIVQDTFERLANRLRCSEITKELAAIEDHESIHYKIKLETLEESMRKMVDEALDSNSQFREAMKVMFTPGGIENSWLAISSWFLASEYIGVMLEEDQVWYID